MVGTVVRTFVTEPVEDPAPPASRERHGATGAVNKHAPREPHSAASLKPPSV
jgi:hypothetical protein